MTRVILQELLLFALPFAAYFLYRLLLRRGQGLLSDTPWFVLSTGGLAIVVASLIVLGLIEGGDPEGKYIPPSYQDGEIVPGRVVPVDDP